MKSVGYLSRKMLAQVNGNIEESGNALWVVWIIDRKAFESL
jgi:hypothetical protein